MKLNEEWADINQTKAKLRAAARIKVELSSALVHDRQAKRDREPNITIIQICDSGVVVAFSSTMPYNRDDDKINYQS